MTPEPAKPGHLLSNELYSTLNLFATLVLPGVGTLYSALAVIWGLPAGEQVVGSIIAVDAFLGVIVKIGEASYDASGAKYDGAINVSDTPDKTTYSIDLLDHPDTLKDKTEATFKIQTPKGDSQQNPAV